MNNEMVVYYSLKGNIFLYLFRPSDFVNINIDK